ncbi:hypothetical protein OG230_32850 [Streptomyces sp. NBC_00234]|uniref:DUF7158 domain-containing protein n=1 Tax=Streptomyces sp. NBC_00234 TaxID=2903638 RepID=UPI002E2C5282|nr:hypothetical protein [Streptomyces sp. NBC_00234]
MTGSGVAAHVGARTVTEEAVEARVTALRRGRLATRLPRPGTADARNLRRWVVQLLTYEAVIEDAAAGMDLSAERTYRPREFSLSSALSTGGVTAAVLASLPVAAAVYDRVTADVTVPPSEVRAYYDRNRDEHPVPYEEAGPAIARDLRRAAADRHFALWLEHRHATTVTLHPGFEHPADPRHADATHRH